MQGNAQANLIRDLLMDRIGAQRMQNRGLVCGNAYAFQGDERDVIFLSLVAATNDGRRIGALSKESDKRRFNVAASRARDQMWLFHSVQKPRVTEPARTAHRDGSRINASPGP